MIIASSTPIKYSDQVPKGDSPLGDGPAYDEREHISLESAIAWGQSFETPITLSLYDEDDGIYAEEVKQ